MALEVSHLSHAFGDRKVLEDVSFEAPSGKLTVVLGRNGCGKSTLLRMISGILPIESGQVKIAGRNLAGLRGIERASLLGYLPQFHKAVFPFRVEDVVLTGRATWIGFGPGPKDLKLAEEAMELLGITGLRERAYSELSGGERQLVMIARILAQRPRIILLDEPTSHLDLANQQRLLGLLRTIAAQGITVLAVLHDPNTAMIHGDAFVFLKEGRCLIPPQGDPWQRDFMESLYGIHATLVPFQDRALVVPEAHHA
jgi:iron complex transport system ATP-binding protein